MSVAARQFPDYSAHLYKLEQCLAAIVMSNDDSGSPHCLPGPRGVAHAAGQTATPLPYSPLLQRAPALKEAEPGDLRQLYRSLRIRQGQIRPGTSAGPPVRGSGEQTRGPLRATPGWSQMRLVAQPVGVDSAGCVDGSVTYNAESLVFPAANDQTERNFGERTSRHPCPGSTPEAVGTYSRRQHGRQQPPERPEHRGTKTASRRCGRRNPPGSSSPSTAH